MRSLFQFFLLLLALCWSPLLASATTTTAYDTASSSSGGSAGSNSAKPLPRRERNLDFLDAKTLAFYLKLDPNTGEPLSKQQQLQLASDPQQQPNVAIMFYVQWDRLSHAVAPVWDAIATNFNAGTKKSNLIMGLFDCESDNQHLQLCRSIGLTHYPSLMFVSPTRTFPHKPKVSRGKGKVPPHATVFPGVVQYDRCIMDWLLTMQRLSSWSAFWNKNSNARKGNWWQKQSPDPSSFIPVGVPLSAAAAMAGGSSTSGASSGSSVQQQQQIKDLTENLDVYEKAVIRSSVMVNAMLFPEKDPVHFNSTDVYAYLNAYQGWDSPDDHFVVVRSCAMEMALDYCSRLTQFQTEELVRKKMADDTWASRGGDDTVEALEQELKIMISTAEPYCDLIEPCILDGFKGDECRTPTCPFQQHVACRYMSACFDESMEAEYAQALGLKSKGTASTAKSSSTMATKEDAATAAGAGSAKQKRGWF